jgi:Fe-S-cluster containining protein
MTAPERILAARTLLQDITPLKTDCGRRCGAACCKPDADGQGGMLLFPGEEALYDPAPDWATITESPIVIEGKPLLFLTCDGHCPREERPLACRIFPLTPALKDGKPIVQLDIRAWPLCPLMPHGVSGLSRDFVAAAQAGAALLCEEATARAYIAWLTDTLADYGRL